MDAAVEIGRNPVSMHQIQSEYRLSRLTRDGTAEPVSRDQILSHIRGQGNTNFLCSADDEQDWQPYPAIHTLLYVMTIHTYITHGLQYCIYHKQKPRFSFLVLFTYVHTDMLYFGYKSELHLQNNYTVIFNDN